MGFRILATCLAAAMAYAASAAAKECSGVRFADQVTVAGSPLALNGLGLRLATMLQVRVYVAGLYVSTPSKDAAAILGATGPKQLVLHLVRDVDADELRDAWEEGFERTAGDGLSALQARIDQVKSWMVDMETGQRLTFTITPGAGSEVDVKGRSAGVIEGDDFSKAFLAIWLGDHPPNPELKAGLLGGSCE